MYICNIKLFHVFKGANKTVNKKHREDKPMEEKILTIEEVQAILRIGKNQAYKLVTEKKIRAFRTGRCWKITESALKEYIAKSEESIAE